MKWSTSRPCRAFPCNIFLLGGSTFRPTVGLRHLNLLTSAATSCSAGSASPSLGDFPDPQLHFQPYQLLNLYSRTHCILLWPILPVTKFTGSILPFPSLWSSLIYWGSEKAEPYRCNCLYYCAHRRPSLWVPLVCAPQWVQGLCFNVQRPPSGYNTSVCIVLAPASYLYHPIVLRCSAM
jgi:hypothetical protein